MARKEKIQKSVESKVKLGPGYFFHDYDAEKKLFGLIPKLLSLQVDGVDPKSVKVTKDGFELEVTYPLDISEDQVKELDEIIKNWQEGLGHLHRQIVVLKDAGLL